MDEENSTWTSFRFSRTFQVWNVVTTRKEVWLKFHKPRIVFDPRTFISNMYWSCIWTDSCSRRSPFPQKRRPHVWSEGEALLSLSTVLSLWVQVWHQPGEHHPVRTEHRDRSHCRPGIALRVRRRGSALSSNVRHESGLPRHKENLLLRRFPQVSLHPLCSSLHQF